MMNLQAHSSATHNLQQLAPAPHLGRTRTDDVHGELPIWPVGVLVWIAVSAAFWGSIAVWILAR
jgi:hypothetical protein